jgi:hypothetical protein
MNRRTAESKANWIKGGGMEEIKKDGERERERERREITREREKPADWSEGKWNRKKRGGCATPQTVL